MRDEEKSKDQLIRELQELRRTMGIPEEGAEAELERTQKLESLGILAAGIAHEFNNVLTAINGNVLLAKMYANPGLEVYDILSEAEKACKRAEGLTRQLLTFAKGGTFFRKSVSLKDLLLELTNLSKTPGIIWDIDLSEGLMSAEIDETQMRQAFANIFANAKEAMPRGGVISVHGANLFADQENLPFLRPGAYIKISIKDQGAGIDQSDLKNIFEPFFSTKGKGRGLGLATALSILRNHEGYIEVETGKEGAAFHVFVPACLGGVEETKADGRVVLAGRKRVLVMDDEEIVRNVVERMLDQCGCAAAFANDGRQMLSAYREAIEEGHRFDAVIIDLIIEGGMGGKEVIGKLLKMDPGVVAIVSSGYSDDPIMSNFKKYGFKAVLPKPYRITELGRVLNEIIPL